MSLEIAFAVLLHAARQQAQQRVVKSIFAPIDAFGVVGVVGVDGGNAAKALDEPVQCRFGDGPFAGLHGGAMRGDLKPLPGQILDESQIGFVLQRV